MSKAIQGVLPIIHTPFNPDDTIDQASLKREIDWAIKTGADGYGSAMASELLRLTPEERVELTRKMVEINAGRVAVFASVGAESTKQALVFAREAEKAGCDAIMAIPPITFALPEKELAAYFGALAEAVDLPLIVQDASGYVGQPLRVEFQAMLLKQYGRDKIMFKPEAPPLGPNVSALRDATNGQAQIFEGSGGILLVDSFRRGIAGTMPGVDLLDGVVALWRALQAGDEENIYRLYFPICALIALEAQPGLDGFLVIEKYIMARRGLFATTRVRKPCSWELDRETREEIDRLLEQLESAVALAASA